MEIVLWLMELDAIATRMVAALGFILAATAVVLVLEFAPVIADVAHIVGGVIRRRRKASPSDSKADGEVEFNPYAPPKHMD